MSGSDLSGADYRLDERCGVTRSCMEWCGEPKIIACVRAFRLVHGVQRRTYLTYILSYNEDALQIQDANARS